MSSRTDCFSLGCWISPHPQKAVKLYSLLCRQLIQWVFDHFRPGMTRSTREKESPELVLQTGLNASNLTGKVTDKKMHILQLYVSGPKHLHLGQSHAVPMLAQPSKRCHFQQILTWHRLTPRCLTVDISVPMAARQKTPSRWFSSCGHVCSLRATSLT